MLAGMTDAYHEGSRTLQDQFDTRRLADRIDEVVRIPELSESDQAFIAARDMMFVATCDPDGQPSVSYKGGDPGFVHVLDERTLAFPSFDGNGMFLTLGNMRVHPKVGLLFVDFTSKPGWRLRVEGHASVDTADPLLGAWHEAQAVVRIAITRVFPNCPRYVHHFELLERSEFVPHCEVTTPQPDWKFSPLAADVLPAGDPARQD